MHLHPDHLPSGRVLLGKLMPLGLLLTGACLLGACAARPQTTATPQQTLVRYRDALDRDDPKAAYALLTKATQQGLPYEQFAREWQETKDERRSQATQLRQLITSGFSSAVTRPDSRSLPESDPIKARAVVTMPQGAQLVLEPAAADRIVQGKPSAWRIVDPDLQVIRAATPEAVLRLLLTAAEQRNYPALLRLLTKSERQSLEAELTERIERLRTSLSRAPVDKSDNKDRKDKDKPGDSASDSASDRTRFQYDPRFFIDLKRESEGWRIADFN